MESLWASFDRDRLGAGRGIEQALRQAIRDGRLGAGSVLPSSRELARELGVARGTVSNTYAQLAAEGYLSTRQGARVRVCWTPGRTGQPEPSAPAAPTGPRFDLRPGQPSGSGFPRAAWMRTYRQVLARVPGETFGYGDERGHPELRSALAGYLGRARGADVTADGLLVCSGFTQALRLICQVVSERGGTTVVVEDPSAHRYRRLIEAAGLRVLAVRCDRDGLCVEELADADAVLVTPAHQYPLGVTMSPARRAALVDWARRTNGLIVEDDYDGEFRYDRQPVGALQQLDPDQVIYVGTASKTLAPALRLGWLSLPGSFGHGLVEAKQGFDRGASVLDQLALAELISSGAFDRHIRRMRATYRDRRSELLHAFGELDVRVEGIAAGLHALVHLPRGGPSEREVLDRAAGRGIALAGLSEYTHAPTGEQAVIVGYGTPPDHAYRPALAELVRILAA